MTQSRLEFDYGIVKLLFFILSSNYNYIFHSSYNKNIYIYQYINLKEQSKKKFIHIILLLNNN
jgi:hypothetical protein